MNSYNFFKNPDAPTCTGRGPLSSFHTLARLKTTTTTTTTTHYLYKRKTKIKTKKLHTNIIIILKVKKKMRKIQPQCCYSNSEAELSSSKNSQRVQW